MDNVDQSMPIIDFDSKTVPGPKRGRTARAVEAAPVPDYFSTQVSQARRFYLTPPVTRAVGLHILSGGCEHCAPDYRICRKNFPNYSIEFVAAGEVDLRLRGNRYRLGPGSIFAYGPGVAHEIENDPDRPLVKYFVDFVGKGVKRLLTVPRPGELVQTSTPNQILPLFDELIRAGLRGTPFSIPDRDPAPAPLEVPPGMRNTRVQLALPLRRGGS